jgi:hypothetical protein
MNDPPGSPPNEARRAWSVGGDGLRGAPLGLGTTSVLATNGKLHEEGLRSLGQDRGVTLVT